eukprot:165397-Pleurochrysis_carterae.AAC.1
MPATTSTHGPERHFTRGVVGVAPIKIQRDIRMASYSLPRALLCRAQEQVDRLCLLIWARQRSDHAMLSKSAQQNRCHHLCIQFGQCAAAFDVCLWVGNIQKQ